MDVDDRRALTSLSRREGEFSLLLDEQFDILWHSSSLSAILGFDDLRGRNGTEFVHPDDLELVLRTMLQANEDDEAHNQLDPTHAPESADIRLLDVNGRWNVVEATTFDHLQDPAINGVLCTCRVVRDRSDVARAIELLGSGAPVDAVLPVVARLADRSMGGVARCAIARRHSQGTTAVTAVDEPALDPRLVEAVDLVWSLGLTESLIITDLDDPRLGGAGRVAAAAGYLAAYLVPIEAPTGSEIVGAMVTWGRSTIDFQAPLQSPLHVALRLAALAISDHGTKRALRWAASHDPLTGLANRAEFSRRLDELAADDLVLLYIDLDDFKPINDAHGHPVGDAVLVEVARRIANVIGSDDVVGRLGGDEFAVVSAGAGAADRGRAIADRIIDAVRLPILANGLRLRVGASVGVAMGAQPLIPSVLIQQADEALYTAKNSGKNTVCLAS
jgi:diguanylate cyclase (GGDEF)-like protein